MAESANDNEDNNDTLNWCLRNGYRVPKWLTKYRIKCPFIKGNVVQGKYGPINYTVAGTQNENLVLTFHGYNASHTAFSLYQSVLSKNGYQVIAFDLYGHGLSGYPRYEVFGNTFTCKFFVEQADELISHLGYVGTPLSVIGISMGACIAAEYCKYHPEVVERLIMISPAGLIPVQPKRIRFLRCFQCCIPCSHYCVSKCCFRSHLKRFDKNPEEGLSPIVNRMLWTLFVVPRAISNILGIVNRMPLWNSKRTYRQVGGLDKLTLFLFGENDSLTAPQSSEEFMEYFTNSHTIIFPNADHLLSYKMPIEVISTCLAFLGIPSDEQISNFVKWLPFNKNGEYIPKMERVIKLNRTNSCPSINSGRTGSSTLSGSYTKQSSITSTPSGPPAGSSLSYITPARGRTSEESAINDTNGSTEMVGKIKEGAHSAREGRNKCGDKGVVRLEKLPKSSRTKNKFRFLNEIDYSSIERVPSFDLEDGTKQKVPLVLVTNFET